MQMLKKGSKLYSIFTGSCPNCQNESMYEVKNPYILSNVFKMHPKCSHCGTHYKIEPSFFYGAMYISYALGVAISVAISVISYLFLSLTLTETFIIIIIALVTLMPIIMRISRNIWVNIFIHYGENKYTS
jgi:uncharacterized protein (DUF983 family)